MNEANVMLVRCADEKWRPAFFAVANLLMDGGLDRNRIDRLARRVQLPEQPLVKLLAAARGVTPQALLRSTTCAERCVWAAFLTAAGLVPDGPDDADPADPATATPHLVPRSDDGNTFPSLMADLTPSFDGWGERVAATVEDALRPVREAVAVMQELSERIEKDLNAALGRPAQRAA